MNIKYNKEDFQRTKFLLKSAIPVFDELLQILEDNKGWFPENDKIIAFLSRLQNPWCIYYENENLFNNLAKHTYFLDTTDDSDINSLLEDATAVLNLSNDDFHDLQKEISSEVQEDKAVSVDDQQKIQYGLTFIYTLITHFFNFLAMMIHGRSMCQLVSDAKNGDDEAFRQAVHIDRTVLQLPYFQQRLLKSQFSNDEVFLNKLASSIRTPILKSKIKYRTLMLTFAMLDDQNMLGLPHEKLLDICEEIGVTGGEHGINDVDKLRKRLHEYRKQSRM